MNYREPLPEGCPPPESAEITAERVVFRLVRTSPPTDADFRSHRLENPGRVYQGLSECQVCGLSVFSEPHACAMALKLPTQRGKQVCRLTLTAGAGRIQQTGKPAHHTWWPFAAFDILAHCAMEAA